MIAIGNARYSGLLVLSFQSAMFAVTAWFMSLAAATSGEATHRVDAVWLLLAGVVLATASVGVFVYRQRKIVANPAPSPEPVTDASFTRADGLILVLLALGLAGLYLLHWTVAVAMLSLVLAVDWAFGQRTKASDHLEI